MQRVPTERVISEWKAAMHKSGRKSISVRALIKHFGLERRSAASSTKIEAWLRENGFYVGDLMSPDLDASVELTPEPVRRIGELCASERELEAMFETQIMPKLGLELVKREYSPNGTRDRLDFLCRDKDGRSVAVELKVETGDRRAVEQLLRYIGFLKAEGGHKHPRGVLITGREDVLTRRALEGREKDNHIRWWIYGVVNGKIALEEIDV